MAQKANAVGSTVAATEIAAPAVASMPVLVAIGDTKVTNKFKEAILGNPSADFQNANELLKIALPQEPRPSRESYQEDGPRYP